jgi:hypothetical protein
MVYNLLIKKKREKAKMPFSNNLLPLLLLFGLKFLGAAHL